jgi:FMN phosphatase YigB (HAD superfamily)
VALRAVVFDLFDTLVDLLWENLPLDDHKGVPIPATTRTLHEAVAERADVDFDTFADALVEGARAFGKSHFANDREVTTLERFEDLVRRLEIEDAALPGVLTEIHMGILRSEVSVPGHHEELLGALAGDLRLGVCSNFSHSGTALGILEEARFTPHLGAIVVSDAFGLRKPRREIFDAVLDRLGVAPEEALHVGDSLRADVGGAASAGIRSAWLTRRVGDPDEKLRRHEGPAPDHTLADLADLEALLAELA